MPVEILELVVRANVQEHADTATTPATTGTQEESSIQKQAIIEECVEQVLEILRNRNER